MKETVSHTYARDLLLARVGPVGTERVPLDACFGRVLAQAVTAADDVPSFDRSPYDGYAVRSADTRGASGDSPVTLRILEEIPAGSAPSLPLAPGTASKILTGAPIPEGCDAVVQFEKTRFTDAEVTLTEPCAPWSNVVRAGEDVKRGEELAGPGVRIDAGLAATIAAQNVTEPLCFRVPRIGIISTGSELAEAGTPLAPGKIYNTNRYTLAGALRKLGAGPVYLGIARDSADGIAAMIRGALETCDAVFLTGGVSVGDYDLTPAAMEMAGCEILFRGVALKPGGPCCYGMAGEVPVCALSGNPMSSVTNFHMVAAPAVRRLCGLRDPEDREITVTLADAFPKKSGPARVLRGRLDLTDGTAVMRAPSAQGNAVVSSLIGCDVLAVIPAGSGPVEKGTRLKGMLI